MTGRKREYRERNEENEGDDKKGNKTNIPQGGEFTKKAFKRRKTTEEVEVVASSSSQRLTRSQVGNLYAEMKDTQIMQVMQAMQVAKLGASADYIALDLALEASTQPGTCWQTSA